MIRILVRTVEFGDAAHVGGPVHESFRTFDVDAPEVEQFLAHKDQWQKRQAIGVELLECP